MSKLDFTAFFNKVATNRNPSPLRELYDNLTFDSSFVIMAGGLPNSQLFPIRGISLTLDDGTVLKVGEDEVKKGLQYGKTAGLPELVSFAEKLSKRLHDSPTMRNPGFPNAHKIIISCGAQDALCKIFEALIDDGDTLLTEEYVYSSVFSTVGPLGGTIQTVRADSKGLIPASLETVLSKWPKPEHGRPSNGTLKALYCVPNGDNPTGARYTTDRKREIYRLAQEYNFLIIEDDAYYFLEEAPREASFLSMDTDGRVIRIDTFSKTLAPGFRLGMITVATPLYRKLYFHSQTSTQGACNVSQMLLAQCLQRMGVDGYLSHCENVCEFYKQRRLACEKIARKHLHGLAEWTSPSGGMFLWIKLPDVADTTSFISEKLIARKVLIVAGAAFSPRDDVESSYVRLSFSNATDEQMEKGFSIIAEEIRKIRDQKSKV